MVFDASRSILEAVLTSPARVVRGGARLQNMTKEEKTFAKFSNDV
eukprot:CAMPEP_0172512910 /NCGR_PEP_ID=MMETSP1066-20121228/248080_1 /TAXON_ID=671091 /ORGANISM="Coscinodiscus wailesii, Strain CCMP2513" /LENGTH=44 /DNA_ID= /DNA_START= /DNA_END= /DNA_ORIENTATION=